MAGKFFYFGFGSNMLASRIHIQNPTAQRIGAGKLKVSGNIEMFVDCPFPLFNEVSLCRTIAWTFSNTTSQTTCGWERLLQ